MIRLIAAIDRRRGVAKHHFLPWHIPDDEKYFTDQTKLFGGHVLTGGTTYRDLYKGPLAERQNFIVTHDTTPIEGATLVNDLAGFLAGYADKDLWVAGGAAIFEQVLAVGLADELYLTHIDADFGCDKFFPEYDNNFKLADKGEPHEQNGFRFSYNRYDRKA